MNFIPYGRQTISEIDISAVVDVLRGDFITQGIVLPEFENHISKKVNCSFSLAVNSATSALHIATRALGLSNKDWLWTSPNTFVASANCALYCGAKVDFVDIDPLTYNLSVDCLRRKLIEAEKTNQLPKIVVAVHYAGQSCDSSKIKELGEKYNFKIIEDASHAIGSTYKNKPVGCCEFSDITVFSFHPVKIITTGEGGAVCTNNKILYEKMKILRSHGIRRNSSDTYDGKNEEIWNYEQIDLGFNYRMTDIQAALGNSQLNSLDKFINKRNKIAERYNKFLNKTKLILPYQSKYILSSYHLYPIRVRKRLVGINQNHLFSFLRSKNIGVNLHYIPVYRHPFYTSLGFKKGYCPEAESFYREVITLPIFPELRVSDQDYVIDNIIKGLEI